MSPSNLLEATAESRPGTPASDLLSVYTAALSAGPEPEAILQTTCAVIGRSLGLGEVTAWDCDWEHKVLVARARYIGSADSDNEAGEGEDTATEPEKTIRMELVSWLAQLDRRRGVLQIKGIWPEFDADGRIGARPEPILGPGWAAPIFENEQMTGLIELQAAPDRTLEKHELVELERLSESLAGHLASARRLHRLQQYTEQLSESLNQTTLALKGERDRTQLILEALGEAVFVADLTGKITYVNEAAIRLTGYTRAELLEQRLRLWRSHRQTAELYTQMLMRIDHGKTWRGEVINERKDGSLYDAAITVAPLFDGQPAPGQLIGFVSVQRDITPVKHAQRLKDRFVSNVSHELRTPLSILTLLVGNLDALYPVLEDSKRRKLIRDVRSHIQQLNELVQSVLELSRIDSGGISRAPEVLDLSRLAREVVSEQLPLARRKAQTLVFIGDDNLSVRVDERHLRQILRNLVDNAIKYTPKGGTITCECRNLSAIPASDGQWPEREGLNGGRWAGVRVADTGVGIPAEDLPHLFERFYRVRSQGNIPGAGLGLSIASELVELNDGHIAVRSQPGEGSIFTVYFPIEPG